MSKIVDRILKEKWDRGDHDLWVALVDGSTAPNLKLWLTNRDVRPKAKTHKRELADLVVKKFRDGQHG